MEINFSVHLYFQCKQCNYSKVNMDTPKLTWNVLFVVVLSAALSHGVLCANRTLPDSRIKVNFRAVAIVLQSNRHGTHGNAKDKNLQWTCSHNDIFQNAVPVTSISGDIARSGAISFQERMLTAKTFNS